MCQIDAINRCYRPVSVSEPTELLHQEAAEGGAHFGAI